MGLIPGAGGTVSIPRRIGRWRTLYSALTGEAIDTDTALAYRRPAYCHTWRAALP
jgi:enoyl-CoA hydratase/carnithine racemase